MDARRTQYKLLAIVGQTATGKTKLALKLAAEFDGEIITADSRTIYKGMDIGTAKPSKEEQRGIRHHLLDIVEPDQRFTAVDFQRLAKQCIKDIHKRGKLPILVGGTGLYINSILYDYDFAAQGAERDPLNPRHAAKGAGGTKKTLRRSTLVIGLRVEPVLLRQIISRRVDKMVEAGLVDEVKRLSERYGWQASALQAPGYKAFLGYLYGTSDLDHAKALFVKNDLQLAKRQWTWFKRNPDIRWYSSADEAYEDICSILNT